MPVDSAEFRRVLGHWATGVAVVGVCEPGGHLRGLTANAFASLSLDPPLVLVCVEQSADSHDSIRAAGAFAISVLSSDQERVARRFASDIADKFDGIAYRTEVTGAPVLSDALAWVDCTLHDTIPGGDHTIFIGRVVAGDATDHTPLLYYRSGYAGLAP